MGTRGAVVHRVGGGLIAGLLLLATTSAMAEAPAQLISRFRLKHGVAGLGLALRLLPPPPARAGPPAGLTSSSRLKHGEVRVVRDSTLDRIAMDQARAMATKDDLSHDALGPFNRRVAPAGAGRAAEN